MRTITVYDPALCCSSGVCGTDVDQNLVDFQAAVHAAEKDGITIIRHNLANDPLSFAQEPSVKTFLEVSGAENLPVIVVEGTIVTTGRYPSLEELRRYAGWTSNGTSRRHDIPLTSSADGCCCGGEC